MDFFSPFTRFANLAKPAKRAEPQPQSAPRATAADLDKAKKAEAEAHAELQCAIRQSKERARIFAELVFYALHPEQDPFAHLAGVDFSDLKDSAGRSEAQVIIQSYKEARRPPALSLVKSTAAEKFINNAAATARAGGPPLPPVTDPTVKFVLDADRRRRGELE
jgi:hypothetical protein